MGSFTKNTEYLSSITIRMQLRRSVSFLVFHLFTNSHWKQVYSATIKVTIFASFLLSVNVHCSRTADCLHIIGLATSHLKFTINHCLRLDVETHRPVSLRIYPVATRLDRLSVEGHFAASSNAARPFNVTWVTIKVRCMN